MNAKQLKDSILQYALEGKLVATTGRDSELLISQICDIKDDLIKKKLLKKNDEENYDLIVDTPHELPEKWNWVKIGKIATVKGGKRVPRGYKLLTMPTPYIYLRVADMKQGSISEDNLHYVDETIYEQIKNYTISSDDIYLTIAGTIGKTGTIPNHLNNSLLTENAVKLINYGIYKPFLKLVLESPVVQNQFQSLINQVAQPKLSIRNINQTLIPLPPVETQIEIVEKVNQLIKKVLNYEMTNSNLENLLKTFPTQLEKSILRYAMQGKLVEQQETDEPASLLVEQIKAEKERLVKEKVLKKERALPAISEEEIPFDIPSTWVWVRVKDISTFGNFNTVQPPNVLEDEWVLDLEDIEKNTSELLNRTTNREKNVKSNKYRFQEGDVLYGKLRPYLNKVLVAPSEGVCTTEIFPVKLLDGINPEYVKFSFMSPYFLNYVNACSYGVKMPRLGTKQMEMAIIPLPPSSEQNRIVDAIKSYRFKCRELSIIEVK